MEVRTERRRGKLCAEVSGAHWTLTIDGCRPLVNVAPNFFFWGSECRPHFYFVHEVEVAPKNPRLLRPLRPKGEICKSVLVEMTLYCTEIFFPKIGTRHSTFENTRQWVLCLLSMHVYANERGCGVCNITQKAYCRKWCEIKAAAAMQRLWWGRHIIGQGHALLPCIMHLRLSWCFSCF